ncbi:MAG: M23 family metallopeptidase [Betaproteobacteria bacterium]
MKLQALSQSIASALATLRQHPRRVAAGLAVLLLGTGVTAFGVAPLAPDAAQLPVTEIVEPVQALPVAQQSDALLTHRFNLYRTEQTRSTDTADSLLSRLNINDPAAAAFLRKDANARGLIFGRGVRTVTAEANDDQQLLKLSLRWATEDLNFFKRLVVERQGNSFVSRIETDRYYRSSRLVSGPINKSLNLSLERAGLSDGVAQQMSDIFGDAMDLSAPARKADRFSAYYEVLEADGEPLRAGRILGAEVVLGGQSLQAMWFRDESAARAGKGDGRGAYYSLDGRGLKKSYLAPLASARVTSGFSMRLNPVLNQMKAHQGIDYAAPPGTPVRAVSDGVVDFVGWKQGYGNVVFIEHGRGHSTVYAHLSSFAVARGQKVRQGDHLGGVGSTGWATGPHLHFEYRINGVHKDPAQVARGGVSPVLTAAALTSFREMAGQLRQQLSAASTLQPALAQ